MLLKTPSSFLSSPAWSPAGASCKSPGQRPGYRPPGDVKPCLGGQPAQPGGGR